MMKTLAIDGSTKASGIAIFEDTELIHYECITANNENSLNRIFKMVTHIRQLVSQYNPNHIVMEEVLPQDVKHNQLVYKALIYLQAAIVMQMHKLNKKVDFIHVSHWRKIVGIKTGKNIKREELKAQSKALVKVVYNIDVNDDISDAILLGAAYIKQNRSAF